MPNCRLSLKGLEGKESTEGKLQGGNFHRFLTMTQNKRRRDAPSEPKWPSTVSHQGHNSLKEDWKCSQETGCSFIVLTFRKTVWAGNTSAQDRRRLDTTRRLNPQCAVVIPVYKTPAVEVKSFTSVKVGIQYKDAPLQVKVFIMQTVLLIQYWIIITGGWVCKQLFNVEVGGAGFTLVPSVRNSN